MVAGEAGPATRYGRESAPAVAPRPKRLVKVEKAGAGLGPKWAENMTFLEPDEAPPVDIVNPAGGADAVLLCDHASPLLPRRLGDLGLTAEQRLDHIGWDIGAAAVARRLSALIDAPLILSGYSRLAIDCNRPSGVPTSIPAITGGIVVPGNQDLSPAEQAARTQALFEPYHQAIRTLLDSRRKAGRRSVVMAVHSFTPNLGEPRPWQIGITYGRDRRLAGALIAHLRAHWPALQVGDNQPYAVTDSGDYAMPVYGEQRGNLHVLIEIRNDGLRDEAGQAEWADRLAACWRALAPEVEALAAAPLS